VWSGQLSVVNQAQLSFGATVAGGAGDWAELLPDSQVIAHLCPTFHPFLSRLLAPDVPCVWTRPSEDQTPFVISAISAIIIQGLCMSPYGQ